MIKIVVFSHENKIRADLQTDQIQHIEVALALHSLEKIKQKLLEIEFKPPEVEKA